MLAKSILEKHTSEQLKAEPYPCKFEFECTQEGKFIAESYRSTHSGGVGYRAWRFINYIFL